MNYVINIEDMALEALLQLDTIIV